MSKEWFKICARQFDCTKHPRHPPGLDEAFAAYTGISRTNAGNILDRLRHLSHCLNELESITLLRLQEGKNQHRRISE